MLGAAYLAGMQHDERSFEYLGQVRYRLADEWVDVSFGHTRREAAGGAAEAFHGRVDDRGCDPIAVRVVRVGAGG